MSRGRQVLTFADSARDTLTLQCVAEKKKLAFFSLSVQFRQVVVSVIILEGNWSKDRVNWGKIKSQQRLIAALDCHEVPGSC